MITEADTCRRYVLPKLYDAGWTDDQISEQKTFTDGRIIVGPTIRRARQKRADYILRYRRDFPIAIVEAKAAYMHPSEGLQQAKEYARILDLNFAYATNGHRIIEYNFITGQETEIYTYSLRQGINDGFLAPYRVHRVITTVDATGWRPEKGEMDRYGRLIPDGEYETKDFERLIVLQARTASIARHITNYLKETDRFAKTIIFCVNQEHAQDMRTALNNLNSDLVKDNYDYVCRVVSDEGEIGRGYLSRFQELETTTPVIVTTSKLLTTGVDIPTCKNIVLARVVNSMTEFKQIIGRGTRVRDDYGRKIRVKPRFLTDKHDFGTLTPCLDH